MTERELVRALERANPDPWYLNATVQAVFRDETTEDYDG